MINDQVIKEYYTNKNVHSWNKIPEEHKEYLKTRFTNSESYKESVWRILYNIEERPVCPICGNKVIFYGKPNLIFAKTCSKKCGAILSEEKRKQTCLKNNGVKHPIQNNLIKEKIKQTNIYKYNIDNTFKLEKVKETRKEKYGVEYLLQSKQIIKKCQETFIKKYGHKTPTKDINIKEKIKQTQIIKYGGNPGYKVGLPEIQEKINNTKRKNNSYNKSQPEDKCYELLKIKYQDIKRQYHSELYPFNCDFYIPSLDLYIEYNGLWTHGFHPYDPNNIEDQNKLQQWIDKDTDFYRNAIDVWTIRDINKRNKAKENNLNFIEFWNLKEVEEWLNQNNK